MKAFFPLFTTAVSIKSAPPIAGSASESPDLLYSFDAVALQKKKNPIFCHVANVSCDISHASPFLEESACNVYQGHNHFYSLRMGFRVTAWPNMTSAFTKENKRFSEQFLYINCGFKRTILDWIHSWGKGKGKEKMKNKWATLSTPYHEIISKMFGLGLEENSLTVVSL